jgi:N-acetyl-gamma-glutamyl-phosphate reductase
MEQGLASMTAEAIRLTFVPHLVPMSRGIHATLFAKLTSSDVDLQSLFETRFTAEPAVVVLPQGSHPATRSVRGANICQLSVAQPQGRDTVVVMSAIDNLVKGAAGQAVQAMNLMLDQPETTGLEGIALAP